MEENTLLVPGVHRLSHKAVKRLAAKRRALKKKEQGEKKTKETKTDEKNLKASQNLLPKISSNVPKPRKSRKVSVVPQKIRPSIKPGKILIILSGRYAGKRVIALKALPSGLILVNGPHKINGVPLRRVNQSNVIATSTSVDISNISSYECIDDSYFSKSLPHYWSSDRYKKPDEYKNATMNGEEKEKILKRISKQKALDLELLKAIKKTPGLNKYLKAKFSLSKGQHPHLMKF